MSYRDDLEAAHARIAHLERALDTSENRPSSELEPLFGRISDLDRMLGEVRAALQSRVANVQEQLASVLKEATPGSPTLVEHNRGFPPVQGGDPSGVRCPHCAALGDDVEMIMGSGYRVAYYIAGENGYNRKSAERTALCPRCFCMEILRAA